MKNKIKTLAVDEIHPYPNNPRKNDRAVAHVKRSIHNYGYRVPVVVDQNHVIVKGHTAFRALIELGYKEVAVVVVELSDTEARAYRLADNRASEYARWDEEMLIPELREVDLTEMQEFFPNLDLSHFLRSDETPTRTASQGDVKKAEESQGYSGSQHELAQVRCPSCKEPFQIRKNL